MNQTTNEVCPYSNFFSILAILSHPHFLMSNVLQHKPFVPGFSMIKGCFGDLTTKITFSGINTRKLSVTRSVLAKDTSKKQRVM